MHHVLVKEMKTEDFSLLLLTVDLICYITCFLNLTESNALLSHIFHWGRNLINKTIWVVKREFRTIHHSRVHFDLKLEYPHSVAIKELGYIAAVVRHVTMQGSQW